MDFQVHRDGSTRLEGIVSVAIDLPLENTVRARLVELDGSGTPRNEPILFQIDPAHSTVTPNLLHFWLPQNPAGLSMRTFRLCLDNGAKTFSKPSPLMSIEEIMYAGQPSIRIQTPGAAYVLHLENGGLARLLDPEGQDWISYNTAVGSAGEYRGIPNLQYPEGYLHPGRKNAQCFVLSNGPLCCQVYVRSLDGQCEALWLFTPQYAQITLLRVPKPYWFLYEGTPAGDLDETGSYIVRSDGVQTSLSEPWEEVLNPGWLYFGSAHSSRVLLLAQQEVEPKLSSYRPMENNMTVFGFGRKKLEHYLEKCPARYRIALLQAGPFQSVQDQVQSVMEPVVVYRT